MAEARSLQCEDKMNDENLNLVEFYQEQSYWLRNVRLAKLPIILKYEMAILFFITTKGDDDDWMIFLEELGLPEFFIYGILGSKSPEPPLFKAFNLMPEKNLWHVMEVFARMKKFHILRHVKPYIESLLLTGENLVHPTAPLLSVSSGAEKTEKKYEVAKESDPTQQLKFPNGNSTKLQKLKVKLPLDFNPIVVFIQHTLSDKRHAVQLAANLRDKGFRVFLSYEISPFLRMNMAQILTDLYRKVDFMVPLISHELLRQINSRTSNEVDFETQSNRFLYDLALREYSKLLRNYRVRPVLISCGINVPIQNDSILSNPFHLWNEFSQFVSNLEITKHEYDLIK